MEDRAAEVTVRVILPEIFPNVAVMAAVPLAAEAAKPLLLTLATAVFEDRQATWVVISRLVPSEYLPEAANCLVTPAGMLGLTGASDIEASLIVDPACWPFPLLPIHPQAVRDNARSPANNSNQRNLIFFMREPRRIEEARFNPSILQ